MSKNSNEERFKKLTKSFGMLEDYKLNPEIVKHKDAIVEFWNGLDNSKRKRIISFLIEVVKMKKWEKAYKEIKV